jgi:hypothetical protein
LMIRRVQSSVWSTDSSIVLVSSGTQCFALISHLLLPSLTSKPVFDFISLFSSFQHPKLRFTQSLQQFYSYVVRKLFSWWSNFLPLRHSD